MMFDADSMHKSMASDLEEPDYVACGDVLYADDTALLSKVRNPIIMIMRNDGLVFLPDGHALRIMEQVVYLGGKLSTTANSKPQARSGPANWGSN
eukprot:4745666-Pyramimonas_sp.AAC.1